MSASWNGYWDGASARDGSGWSAELRIPISTLRFAPGRDGAVMGLILHRRTASRSEMATFPRLSSSFSNALFRPSIARKIHLAGIGARSPAYLTPYVLGGVNSAATFDPAAPAWGRSTDVSREAGLDLKLGLTSNVTADLTVNTDFAQVEADDQQVNLTRFSLFFPEKRQFFLERSDVFQLGLDNGPAACSTAGGSDWPPTAVRSGSMAAPGWSAVPGALISARCRCRPPRPTAGGPRTTRWSAAAGDPRFRVLPRCDGDQPPPDAGGHNVAVATDAVIHAFGNDYFTGVLARSFDDARPGGAGAGLARVSWARRSQRGLVYSLSATWQGADFEPGLGFLQRRDVTSGFANVRYGWFPGARSVDPEHHAEPGALGRPTERHRAR